MAITDTAAFAQTTNTGSAVATLASVVTSDTPTNTIKIATAGLDGALLTKLTAIPRNTVTASGLYLFISGDAGATKQMLDCALMPAYTWAATTDNEPTIFDAVSEGATIRLAPLDELYVSSAVALADGIVFNAEWTDF